MHRETDERCDICGAPFVPDIGIYACSSRVPKEIPVRLYRLEKRVYLDGTKKRVVSPDSPEATFFLGPEGHEIPYQYATELGLVSAPETQEAKDVETKEQKERETKEPGELSEYVRNLLRENGLTTAEKVRKATDQELLDKSGIGPSILMDIRRVYPYEE